MNIIEDALYLKDLEPNVIFKFKDKYQEPYLTVKADHDIYKEANMPELAIVNLKHGYIRPIYEDSHDANRQVEIKQADLYIK